VEAGARLFDLSDWILTGTRFTAAHRRKYLSQMRQTANGAGGGLLVGGYEGVFVESIGLQRRGSKAKLSFACNMRERMLNASISAASYVFHERISRGSAVSVRAWFRACVAGMETELICASHGKGTRCLHANFTDDGPPWAAGGATRTGGSQRSHDRVSRSKTSNTTFATSPRLVAGLFRRRGVRGAGRHLPVENMARKRIDLAAS
jgi:hypothetical protein